VQLHKQPGLMVANGKGAILQIIRSANGFRKAADQGIASAC
jgi:TPR repeat protein